MSDGENFLKRWSRLKLVVANPPPPASPPVVVAPLPELHPDDEEESAPIAVEESPYSALLRADMPDDLRHQALRSLWRSDEAFSTGDAMTDYGNDFHRPDLFTEVRSAWQVGRGYEEEVAEAAEAAEEDMP